MVLLVEGRTPTGDSDCLGAPSHASGAGLAAAESGPSQSGHAGLALSSIQVRHGCGIGAAASRLGCCQRACRTRSILFALVLCLSSFHWCLHGVNVSILLAHAAAWTSWASQRTQRACWANTWRSTGRTGWPRWVVVLSLVFCFGFCSAFVLTALALLVSCPVPAPLPSFPVQCICTATLSCLARAGFGLARRAAGASPRTTICRLQRTGAAGALRLA